MVIDCHRKGVALHWRIKFVVLENYAMNLFRTVISNWRLLLAAMQDV